MSTDITLRRARADDMAALYAICLATGNAGADASLPGRQGELLGHLFAGPYLQLAPDFAWVAEDAGGVCGYALGTDDSARFYARMESEWLPPLRQRYREPRIADDRWLIDMLHRPCTFNPQLMQWPAHLHIDLLPRAQGTGLGSRLMRALLDDLRRARARGVHLGVDPRNERAAAWYPRFGFTEQYREPGCIWFAMPLHP
ncbi:GNAT family N-acetyltransferase [Chitinimonas sp. BJYL2]|uniref:GNAT family N-acetyltransferase n=1 Tax=Chitinimonas sp. BJYL2 TaxID=2976696 RepID=UPI0022B5D862|nr:GNAT family N-acetyltransferase [Chitinimonas sp. BJYL2]